jgi:hypothetical protein
LLQPRLVISPRGLSVHLFFIDFVTSWNLNLDQFKEKPVSIVCSKCKKSLTVKGSILKTHECGHSKTKGTPHMSRKTADYYVKAHFTELIAAEMRKTVA